MDQPTLHTPRLTLRPFALADAAAVQRLAGAREVADATLHIPHPYPDGAAEEWIGTHAAAWEARTQVTYAITLRDTQELIGAMGIIVSMADRQAEIGYWLGVPYWNRGYCTEAAAAVFQFAFDTLALHRMHSCHFPRNPASGRVMQKLGMRQEGLQRAAKKRWDAYEDVVLYGLLAEEWFARAENLSSSPRV
jgi:[ribosomal protein S5]-alanine N-acetyltransferase